GEGVDGCIVAGDETVALLSVELLYRANIDAHELIIDELIAAGFLSDGFFDRLKRVEALAWADEMDLEPLIGSHLTFLELVKSGRNVRRQATAEPNMSIMWQRAAYILRAPFRQ